MPEVERRLVAIMFTDIVGYTAMMGEDEENALKVVHQYELTVKTHTSNHSGTVINFYGDGSLVIFNSVHDAVSCAMDIQSELRSGLKVPLRIGIHVGEVVLQEGNAYGDGVNIASRIESLGQPGAILYSEDVYKKIFNSSQYKHQLLGSFEFKNVQQAMNIYALANDGFHVPPPNSLFGKLKVQETTQEKSIAVLPFLNLGEDSHNQFLIDGISDEIRSHLLSINDLKVISRSSSQFYKNKEYTLQEVGKDLGVSHILEGRVLVIGDKIKLSIELNNTATDKQIWSLPPAIEALDDISNLQINIAKIVADQLRIILSDTEKDAIKKIPTVNQEAFVEYQKGLASLHRGYGKIEELNEAIAYFEAAIQLDPNFSKAYVGLSDTYLEHIFWGRRTTKEVLDPAMNAAMKALELDNTNGECLGALGAIHFYKFNKHEAKNYLNRAIQLSPNYLGAYEKLAWLNIFENNFEKAIELFTKAHSLDPLSTKYAGDIGHAYYYAGQFDEGIDHLSNLLKKHPGDSWLQWMKAYLLSGKGSFEEAIDILTDRATSGKNTNWMLAYNYAVTGQRDKAEDILDFHLRKRKLDYVPAYMIAVIYAGLGEIDNTLKWLTQDAEDGGQGLFSMGLRSDSKFEKFRNNPHFQELLSKVY